MKVMPTPLAGVFLIEPRLFEDDRGTFIEAWHAKRYHAAGIDAAFVQENQSRSRQGTLRGLHYQVERPQGKLVRVVHGEIFDVAVDLRRSSPTFGQWTGVMLSAENRLQLWIPPGLAHGFTVLTPHADMLYLCTELYDPDLERTIAWDDKELAIDWQLHGAAPLLSPKDGRGLAFANAPHFA